MKVCVLWSGCPTSLMESEIIKGILKKKYEIVENPEDADVIILHWCTLKTPSENKALKIIRKFKDKKIIISGCLADHRGLEIRKKFKVSLVGVNRILEIEKAIENDVILLGGEKFCKLCFERIIEKKVIAPVIIEEGCEFNCSFCAGKLVRRDLFSYPKEKIINEIRKLLQRGVKEIWITGQDVGAWGRERGEKLTDLLKEILKIEEDFRIRIGMMNPPYARILFEDLVEIYEDHRVFKFLHVPVQSGSNRILKLMRRPYTVEFFEELIEDFRKEIPKISIATDVIVGFPTETEEEFYQTVELIKRIKPDFLNISRFWARPGTEASKLKQFPGWETKRRSRIMTEVYKKVSLERNLEWVGWKGEVIVDEIGKDAVISRNIFYKPIVIREDVELGSFIKVKVVSAKEFFLEGKLIKI